MQDINNILNIMLNDLKNNVSNVDFTLYYPSRSFGVPLKEHFTAVIEARFNIDKITVDNTKQVGVRVQLISPVGCTGNEVLKKAKEIAMVLEGESFDQQSTVCSIGNITYTSQKRSYVVNIDVEYSSSDGRHITILTDNGSTSAILLDEKILRTSTDIKVYGESKPFDTILETQEYKLSIQIFSNDSEVISDGSFGLEYSQNNCTVKYTDCVITQCTCYITRNVQRYEVTAKNRVVIRNG